MASGQTKISGLSGRYATALFELACEANIIDAVAEDLSQLQGMIDESADLRRLIQSPLFSRESQSKAMAALTQRAGLSDVVCNTVGVISANRRLFALENIIRDFKTLVADHRGEVEAEIITAVPLSAGQCAALAVALKRAIGSSVSISMEVNPELLGGLVVRVGSRMVDSSLRTKLHKLQLAMKGAA